MAFGISKYPGGPADLAAKLHPGEPWFAVRAQDKLAVEVVREYARQLLEHCLIDESNDIRAMADRFEEWQNANPDKVKMPD
ncbi:MAG: hypothetical protein L0312_16270 [Acidobacteria bacterium]|nr:hypothetical protein [Acidobacteriota bacterium]